MFRFLIRFLNLDYTRYFTFLALAGHLLRFQFEGHILVEFLGQKQIEVVIDTRIGIGCHLMPLLFEEFYGRGRANIEFFTSFNEFYRHKRFVLKYQFSIIIFQFLLQKKIRVPLQTQHSGCAVPRQSSLPPGQSA